MEYWGAINLERKEIELLSDGNLIGYLMRTLGIGMTEATHDTPKYIDLCTFWGYVIKKIDDLQKEDKIILPTKFIYTKKGESHEFTSLKDGYNYLKESNPDKKEGLILSSMTKNLKGDTKSCYGGVWRKDIAEFDLKDFSLVWNY